MKAARNLAVRILISARDEASSVFDSLQAKVAAVGAAIATYFGARLFGDAVGAARDFESAMSAVQAAAGASGEELEALRAAAETAGSTTKYSSVEAAGALENLAKAGLSATDAVQALPAVLDLAAAGGVGLGEASDYISKAVAGMGLSFAEAGRVADVLAMGANASNTSVVGLAQALSYAAPLANSLGLNLEQTVAIIGKFADAGIDASRAGTALNSILAQFSDPASKFRQELAAAGIITGDFNLALRQLAASGPQGQRAINAVGQEAGPALRALLNQGIGSLDALKTKLDESSGSARSFAAVMGDNLDGATRGFASAWNALLIKLGTPVLDPLRNQINAVAERLRGFVADGTATAFGNARRTAFESAGKWVAEFVATVDFTQVAANLQAFAARTGEAFASIGQHATAAGSVLQTAYGVMVTGTNTVLAAVYKVGEGASWLASAFLSDLALIANGISKITFGSVSEGFASAAASMRLEAQATYSVSEEFGRKSTEAFNAAVAGAETAAAGWKALTTATTEATPAVTGAGAALEAVGAQAAAAGTAMADAAGKAGEAAAGYTALGISASTAAAKYAEISAATGVTVASMRDLTAAVLEGRLQFDESSKSWRAGAAELAPISERMAAADAAAAKFAESIKATSTAASESTATVATLRAEYARLIADGNLQGAAEKLQQIEAAMNGLGKGAQSSTEQVAAAFQRLEISSEAALKGVAENARRDFEIIKNSGSATARDIQNAFAAYAERAVAANNGVASSTLKIEAAQNGLSVTADGTGKVIVQSMLAAAEATREIGNEAQTAAGDLDEMGDAAERAAEKVEAARAGSPDAGTGSWEDWTLQDIQRASSGAFGPVVQRQVREWVARKNEERARQREEADRQGEARDAAPVGGRSRQTGISAAGAYDSGPGNQKPAPVTGFPKPERVVRLEFNFAGRNHSLFGGPSDMDAFFAALERAKSASGVNW